MLQKKTVLLFSIGKDSTTLLHLCQKAFSPAKIPFSLLHIDTGYKFPEMYQLRDKLAAKFDVQIDVYRNEKAIADGANPKEWGTSRCCHALKTTALLDALKMHKYEVALGGARRDEEASRSKERIFSVRNSNNIWDPTLNSLELDRDFIPKLDTGETLRVFPLSNWTELDVWRYIKQENIDVVPLYFSKMRGMQFNKSVLIRSSSQNLDVKTQSVECRFRSLGCVPCTGAVKSSASTLDDIISEVGGAKDSERKSRVIDHASNHAMEKRKRDGYF